MTDTQITKVHFIGIGGVGMSGIARVAHDQGMTVSGSDLKESRYTKELKKLGVKVFIGHEPSNLPSDDLDVVVVSTAILDNNPELIAAKEQGLTIWHRARMLAELGVGKKTLAVAGTHGKTTSSSMLASTLDAIKIDPSFLVGGIVRAYGTNAHSGTGDYYIVEADESDKSFTYLDPTAVLVTNIEADHLDHYDNLDEIYSLFEEFMASGDPQGFCVVWGEDTALVEIARRIDKKIYTYGFESENDFVISDYKEKGVGSTFTVSFPDGVVVTTGIKQNPGRHNALNAAGVLGMIWALDLPVEQAAIALSDFAGVKRRFDLIGEVNDIVVVDDYAHHPTEIAATISAAQKLDFKRVHVLFQPHRYSRVSLFTDVLRDEFCHAFDLADNVTFMDVYAAGEMPVPGVSGKTFMDVILDQDDPPRTHYVPRRVEVVPSIVEQLEPGDLLLTMGAGDVTAIAPLVVRALKKKQADR